MIPARTDEKSHARHRSNSKPYMDPIEQPRVITSLMDDEESSSRKSSSQRVKGAPFYPQEPSRKPLVDHCTNAWQHGNKWKSRRTTSPDGFEEAVESFFGRCLAIIKAPKIRRNILLYTVVFIFSVWLWSSAIWPVWKEERALSWSLSAQNKMMSGGVFGSNLPPTFRNMIQVKDLDPRYVPKGTAPKHPTANNVNRLIFVGDVHGCLDELKALLKRVEFNPKHDHLVTTGDLISKGPESARTVDFVRELGASCVRGNHEDRILLIAQDMKSSLLHLETPANNRADNLNEQPSSPSNPSDRALASSLSPSQLQYLESCPVILRVGFMKPLAGDLVVVHAGLIPGIPLEHQDPTAAMTMRSIDLDTHIPSQHPTSDHGVHWIKLWNKHQKSLPAQWSLFPSRDTDAQRARESHTTVVYGHDAGRGLQLKQYSKGIDTGCVRGGKLTALILSDGGFMQTRQVQCKDYRERSPLEVGAEDVLS